MRKLISILAFILLIPSFSFGAWSDCNIWLDNSLKRYRQGGTDGTSGSSTLTIKMAKNEIQSFQVLFYNAHAADAQTVDDVTVTEGTSTITYIKLFKQHYLNLDGTYKSICGATTGYMPEVLIPKEDEIHGEARNGPDGFPDATHPVSVTAQKVQGFWVDVGTTSTTPAGTYTLNIAVKRAGETDKTATVTVQVWNFALPSDSTTKIAMALGGTNLGGVAHGLSYTDAYSRLRTKDYLKLLLYHKLGGVYSATDIVGYNASGNVSSWTNFDTTYGAALDGTAIASGPYAGAKLNVMGFHPYGTGSDTEAHYTTALTDWWNKMGTSYTQSQLYLWPLYDEPVCTGVSSWGDTVTQYQYIAKRAKIFYDLNGNQRKTFATKGRRVSGTCPTADLINPGAGYTSFDTTGIYVSISPEQSYVSVQGEGYKIPRASIPNYYNWTNRDYWWYLSNGSHGALWNEDTGSYDGQVDTAVDIEPVKTRLIAWTMWYYRIHGFLYYSTVECWNACSTSPANQPFNNIANEGGQGDGTLIWPGVTDCTGRSCPTGTPSIGGTTDTILGGITLKLLRDSMQDREYMELARTLRSEGLADNIVNQVFTTFPPNTCVTAARAGCTGATTGEGPFYCLNTSTSNLLTKREALADLILGGSGGTGTGSLGLGSGGSTTLGSGGSIILE